MTTTESLDEVTPEPSSPVLTDANEQHKVDLLEQFYLTLQVTYMASPLPPSKSVIHERIERLFKAPHSWPNAYEIEQLLCFVISDQQLETELNRRLAEAQQLKLEHVAIIDKELHPDGRPPADKRIVLHRLLNDLQWFYSKRVQHRTASKRLLVRVSMLFMVALAAFSLVLFIQFFAHPKVSAGGNQAGAGAAAGSGAAATTPAPDQTSTPPAAPAAGAPAAPASNPNTAGNADNTAGGAK